MKTLFERLCQTSALLAAWKAVKQKGSSGGIDGINIQEFDEQIGDHIKNLQCNLQNHEWNPEPYLQIHVPKNENERRKLGLLCIKDKIVQQAIKQLVEPRFEKVFINNSYGYRPNKGHTRAIKFAHACCKHSKYPIVLRLDIDNYFDNIDHAILFRRIRPVVGDEEILRLIELCVKMGVVTHRLQWNEVTKGIPQGAVLSPLLANYYFHSFDQFVLSRTKMYVRYADDFIICCENTERAEVLLKEGTAFLEQRLKLQLNPPCISEIKKGFEFLGITLNHRQLSISTQKKAELFQKIEELDWCNHCFTDKGLKHLQGIKNYYAPLLPQNCLKEFDQKLFDCLKSVISKKWKEITGKIHLQKALKVIDFYAEENILKKGELRSELVSYYLRERNRQVHADNEKRNRKLIVKRKREYRKKENEATELIIDSYGTYIGVSNKGITLKIYGKQQEMPPTRNLSHITVLCNGVSISSNAIGYCMQQHIPVDFFNSSGHHVASILSSSFMHTSLWQQQAMMTYSQRMSLAKRIIYGKVKNQLNLIKYYHKYHKASSGVLRNKYEEVVTKLNVISKEVNTYHKIGETYRADIMQWEANAALLYWGYMRELISDDDVGFKFRDSKGATDLVNCLLNFGYAILYARVWQSLLHYKLNPMDSILHVGQPGKPTFVYDVIELFRAQAVDRVVISLVQKREWLVIAKGLLTEPTKKLLVQNVLERLNRYEIYRGREVRFCDIINLQVKAIADYISTGTTFKPYIAKW